MISSHENTILLLHPATVNPSSFLSRLTNSVIDDTAEDITWKIDNKYYTANVTIQAIPLDKSSDEFLIPTWRDVDVIIYTFEKTPVSSPPTLIKLLSTPRDIALAIRTVPSLTMDTEYQEGDEGVSEETGDALQMEEISEEIGMEFIDEVNHLTEDDDERPMEPLEVIRQTLQTHIWPNMARKPLNVASTSQIPTTISPSSSTSSSPRTHAFPETFQASININPPIGPSGSSFPGLDELRAEIFKADYGDIDRLNKLDDDFGFSGLGPSQDEYTRLEEWLDSDEEGGDLDDYQSIQDDVNAIDPDNIGETALDSEPPRPPNVETYIDTNENDAGQLSNIQEGDWQDEDDMKFDPILSDLPPKSTRTIQKNEEIENKEKFEDDFDDFAEFQDGPSVSSRNPNLEDPTLSLDPTPLLLHLQSVRAELAGVTDEDERRVRAGKEVQQILATLGLGEMEDDLGLEEMI
ncbi:uncharacterized protein I206_101479 [Kwoniella pini CBS 10737]|uniref:Alpha and gamma adaptin binding protein p34 n=1 Tax=Kwoniella pini CBS 10737 TaxID=1296096 RepID=A0A1B9HWJ2_9TREE|nr:uncharacterized protein I206_06548 [Kwoniella pini CBS 10737]OCF47644.1 hypothetical protein I206_06548 [Kwoniella pini CBS 10737]